MHLLNDRGVIRNTDFKFKEFINVTQLMRAFERDLIDIAAVTIDEAITLSELTNDLTIIFVLDVSSGGDAIISKKTGMELRDIRGRKVGVEVGSVSSYLLSRALEIAEISFDEIKIVPLTIDQHLRSIQRGEVDFICTFNPVREMILAETGHVVFDSKSIPNEIVDVLVTKKQKVKEYHDSFQLLLQTLMMQMERLAQNDPNLIEEIALLRGKDKNFISSQLNGIKIPVGQENLSILKRLKESSIIRIAKHLYSNGQINSFSSSLVDVDTSVLEGALNRIKN